MVEAGEERGGVAVEKGLCCGVFELPDMRKGVVVIGARMPMGLVGAQLKVEEIVDLSTQG